MLEQWKATLEWYKQLTTVNGAAGVAVAAFLTYAGKPIDFTTVLFAYFAIFAFLISVLLAIFAMFRVINYVDPNPNPGNENPV